MKMNKNIVLLLVQSFFLFTIDALQFCDQLPQSCSDTRFRSFDGLCNHLTNGWVGARTSPYKRLLPPKYDDDSGTIKSKAKSGNPLPSPRDVSLNCHFPREGCGPLSILGVIFGQFVTHDVSQASPITINGSSIPCSLVPNNTECINLATLPRDTLNQDQPFFEISRTAGVNLTSNCVNATREQVNQASHWLDLSVIYGSSSDIASQLRLHQNGSLITSNISNLTTTNEFLPKRVSGTCVAEIGKNTCFASGDSRPNENLVLNSIQVLFVREHNRIARKIAGRFNGADRDERIYQEARRYLGAMYQHIIYNEWLPLIIGKNLYLASRLNPLTSRTFLSFSTQSYDSTVKPYVYNEFMGAAFRCGHTLLQSNYSKRDFDFNIVKTCDLNEITFNPTEAYEDEGVDGFLRGAVIDCSSTFDPHISNTPENHLLENDPNAFIKRSSLSTLSIQRGRDHAFQPYLEYRRLCNLRVATSFDDLTDMSSDVIEALRSTYESVEDIELYTGGLSELPLPNAVVGPTFACIIAKQFQDWKKGDRYYYESKLSFFELPQIKNANMARIICDNVNVTRITRNPFLPPSDTNPFVNCSSLPFVNF